MRPSVWIHLCGQGARKGRGRRAYVSEGASILTKEDEHEGQRPGMLDEERLRYASSVVLGRNDALVELTLALRNAQLIALSGKITGLAPAFSMAASEHWYKRAEQSNRRPLRAAVQTCLAYVLTVVLLIWPYLLLDNEYQCLAITLTTAVFVIAVFYYCIAVARSEDFQALSGDGRGELRRGGAELFDQLLHPSVAGSATAGHWFPPPGIAAPEYGLAMTDASDLACTRMR